MIPAGRLLSHLPAEHFGLSIEAQIRQGRQFRSSPFVVSPGAPLVRALSQKGDLIAIGRLVVPNLYQPETVLQPELGTSQQLFTPSLGPALFRDLVSAPDSQRVRRDIFGDD